MKKLMMLILISIFIFAVIFSYSNKEKRELTTEEIAQVNTAFEPGLEYDSEGVVTLLNPITFMFTSYYENPKDLDFEEFLKQFETRDMIDAPEVNEVEFNELREHDYFYDSKTATLDTYLPTHRKPVESINNVLQRYAGITVDDLDTGIVPYLGDPYYSFYNHTSDWGYPIFDCVGGKISGDTIRLFSNHAILTLEKKDGEYLIVSYLLNAEDS